MNGQRSILPDVLICGLVGLVGLALSLVLNAQVADTVYINNNILFGSDTLRVTGNMTSIDQFPHYRTSIHPVFSFLIYPPARALIGQGFAPVAAAAITVAASALVTCCAIYAFGRFAGLLRRDAVLLCAVFISSAAFTHWWSVPETFSFGGMAIALAFAAAIAPVTGRLAWVCIATLTLAFTVTNWLAGLLAASARLPWREVLVTGVLSFLVVVVLSIWQLAFIPTAKLFFLPASFENELMFVNEPAEHAYEVSAPIRLASYVTNNLVASDIRLDEGKIIRPVHLSYGATGWIGLVAVWGLLAVALWNAVRVRAMRTLVLAPALFLGFQVVLHMLYGDEPFLYAAHFVPALMCILALGFLGGTAAVARAAAIAFCLFAGHANVTAFLAANKLAATVVGAG